MLLNIVLHVFASDSNKYYYHCCYYSGGTWVGFPLWGKSVWPICNDCSSHFSVVKIVYWVGDFGWWAGLIYLVDKVIYWVGKCPPSLPQPEKVYFSQQGSQISHYFLCISLSQKSKFPSKWLNFPAMTLPKCLFFPTMPVYMYLLFISLLCSIDITTDNILYNVNWIVTSMRSGLDTRLKLAHFSNSIWDVDTWLSTAKPLVKSASIFWTKKQKQRKQDVFYIHRL